jgi:hypothetical protein
MTTIPDPIAIHHPSMPGEFFVIARRQLVAHQRRGWVEAKSPASKKEVAAVEAHTSPRGTPTPRRKRTDP